MGLRFANHVLSRHLTLRFGAACVPCYVRHDTQRRRIRWQTVTRMRQLIAPDTR